MIVAQLRGAEFERHTDGNYSPVVGSRTNASFMIARGAIQDVAHYFGFQDEDEYLAALNLEGRDVLKRVP